MKKVLLSLLALLPLACNQSMENKSAPEAPAAAAAATTTDVRPDVPQRAAQLPKTPIDYDRALLNDNERQVVAKADRSVEVHRRDLLAAGRRGELTTRDAWAARAAKSPLETAGYEYSWPIADGGTGSKRRAVPRAVQEAAGRGVLSGGHDEGRDGEVHRRASRSEGRAAGTLHRRAPRRRQAHDHSVLDVLREAARARRGEAARGGGESDGQRDAEDAT
jgi:hypothetical protein